MTLSAERLFAKYFAPLYPPEDLADLAAVRSRDANPGQNPAILAQLGAAAVTFAKLAPLAFDEPDLDLDFSDASVHRLAALLTRERRDGWLEPKERGETAMIVKVVTHGALYVGACVVKNHRGTWLVRRPTWESLVRLESRAGTGDLALFQWWLKAMSDEEIDKGRLGDRYRTHVEVPTFDADALAVIAPADRTIPRLSKVRYDTLHKHLRAQIPEIKSVGDDFPSPERFDEMGFKWLELLLVGGGKMLLVHGPGKNGVHLFWLDLGGFVKSAFYPADPFPEHVVALEGDKVRVIVSIQGKPVAHEMMWWGT